MSETQVDEATYLNEKYFKNMPNGVYVEVGAMDGELYSTTKLFEDNHNWTGLLIEPNPVQFESLQKNRPNSKTVNTLVSDSTEPLEYQYFLTNYAAVSGVTSTLPEKHLEDYFKCDSEWIKDQPRATETLTPRTLTDLVKENNLDHIDLLTVDVEGHEVNVLRSFDFTVPVYMAMVDVTTDDSATAVATKELLEAKDFVFVESYNGNHIYVNKNVRLDNTHLTKPLYEAPYDIVYNVGSYETKYNPIIMMLSDETFLSMAKLCEEWVKAGKKVAICGNFEEELMINDVVYLNWDKFPKDKHVGVLIAWRASGITSLLNGEYLADKVVVDFHDNFPYSLEKIDKEQLEQFLTSVACFYFKSEYHKKCFEEYRGSPVAEGKSVVLMNGINTELYAPNEEVVRQPFRFCYYASYHKGLDVLLAKVWPFIFANEPRAELHVYHGMENIPEEEYRAKMRFLLGQPGVMDHGRQPLVLVAREKHTSTFHLHINNLVDEVDATTVRESLRAGCIPLISKFGVFLERHGLQFDWDPTNDQLCALIAKDILEKMHNDEFVSDARKQLSQSYMTESYEVVAKKWLDTFQ
jgi:FkbM family methyltransferase